MELKRPEVPEVRPLSAISLLLLVALAENIAAVQIVLPAVLAVLGMTAEQVRLTGAVQAAEVAGMLSVRILSEDSAVPAARCQVRRQYIRQEEAGTLALAVVIMR